MDETMLTTGSRSQRVIVPREWKRAPTLTSDPKVMHITFTMCVAADGTTCRPLVILPLQTMPSDLEEAHEYFCWAGSTSGWINADIFDGWCEKVFLPFVRSQRQKIGCPKAPALLWLDGHGSRSSEHAMSLLKADNVFVVTIPGHTSHIMQPLDCGVNRAFKAAMHRHYREPVDKSTPNIRQALIHATLRANHASSDPHVVKASWRAACIFPYEPNRLLLDPTKVVIPDNKQDVQTPKKKRGPSISGRVLVNPSDIQKDAETVVTPTKIAPNWNTISMADINNCDEATLYSLLESIARGE